ncbi:MAG: DNA methyltransferase, partial [Bacillota bacterium]|nr:DNA methyltransferase [Bacillota bacterium]
DFIENMSEGKVYRYNDRLIFKTSSGTIRYYHSFSNSLQITNDYDSSYTRSTARGDLWKNYHIDMRNISKEGGVIFKNSKKPERLIYDLLYAFTNPGDIVLDSFLGSGTTIAVAHKMNRKWIGIEMGEHQMFQLAKPRIDRIIDNKDQTGVTNRTNWNGGGAYRFYEVASSLVKFDEFEQPIINSDYNADMLAAAIALHEGYKYNPSQEVFWKQAHSSENSFLFVTTNHVNHQYLDSIYNQLEENEFLLISCKSFDSNIDKKYKNISIKKIPDSILKNCEFEKDNYNLNIINPPSYEEEDDYYE